MNDKLLIANMNYYHSKLLVNVTFDEAIEKVTEALKAEGFGILT